MNAQLEKVAGQLERDGFKVEVGDGPGKCSPLRITYPDGSVVGGVLCGGRRAPRRRCEFCRANWSSVECDYLTGGPCKKCKGTGRRSGGECHACVGRGEAMCNRRACDTCAAHRDPDTDFCPDHRVQMGFPPLVRREPCYWIGGGRVPLVVNRKCLHRGCETLVEAGEPALYFQRRGRAMCAPCGEAYLKIAV